MYMQGRRMLPKSKGGKAYKGGHLQEQSRPIKFLYEGLKQCQAFHCATYTHAQNPKSQMGPRHCSKFL